MDGSRWAGRRTAVVVFVLIALLCAVAIASTGSTPGGSGGARRPSDWLLDVIISLLLVVMALGSVLLVVLVIREPTVLVGSTVRRPRSRLMTIVSLGVFFTLLALVIHRVVESDGARRGLERLIPAANGDPAQSGRYEPQFQAIPVLVVLALVGLGLTALLVARRARAQPPPLPDLSAGLAEVIDDTLDDLRAERDPRRAVIATYARLERVLAAYGVPRRASEAPEEYLGRVLADLDVPREAVSRLTALFARAKFSHHQVAAGMKDEAIRALETVRDELREAARAPEDAAYLRERPA